MPPIKNVRGITGSGGHYTEVVRIVNADEIGGGGSGGGTKDHRQLENRDAPNQHPKSSITDLVSDLSAKADLVSGKVPAAQLPAAPVLSVNTKTGAITLNLADFPDIVTALAAKANLVGGKVPASELPLALLAATFDVATAADLVTLTTAEPNDFARVTSESKSFVLVGDDPTVAGNWLDITGQGGLISVNGKTGIVTIDLADLPSAATALAAKADKTDLDVLAPKASPALTGTPTVNGNAFGAMAFKDDAPSNGKSHSRKDGAWVETAAPDSGLPTGGAATSILTGGKDQAAWSTPESVANTLPAASATQPGVVKVGSGLKVESGVLSATGGGSGGGTIPTLIANSVEVPFDEDSKIAVEMIGRVLVHQDPENRRVQYEVLDTTGGSGSDPEDPAGWGNWPVGDVRFLPGVTVPPPGTKKCDGTFERLSSYPDIVDSPHITMQQDELTHLIDAAAIQEPDGPWSVDPDGNKWWSTYGVASKTLNTSNPAGAGFYINSGGASLFWSYKDSVWQPYEGVELITKFAKEEMVIGYSMTFANDINYCASSLSGNTLKGGRDTWNMYGLVNPDFDPLNPQDSDWELVSEETNRYITQSPEVVPFPGKKKYFGVKMKLVKANVGAESFTPGESAWPNARPSTSPICIFGYQIFKSDVFQVPLLTEPPTSGVQGIWCIRLKEGEVGTGSGQDPVLTVQGKNGPTVNLVRSDFPDIDQDLVRLEATVGISDFPGEYRRSEKWSSVANTMVVPSSLDIDVGGDLYRARNTLSLELDIPAQWDDPQFATAANRAGKDFYVYGYANGDALSFVLSNNSTVPSGGQYTAGNTRKLGGFHCLCADVGTIAGHPLSGMTAGQILPASVWDLRHRPVAEPVGMAYSECIDAWVQIYVAGIDGYSRFGVPFAADYNTSDIEGCPAGSWLWFNNTLGKMNMRLPLLSECLVIARGSALDAIAPEDYNPNAGGHTSKSGRRMISNIGLEDVCGYIPQLCGDVCTPYNVPGLDASSEHVVFDGYGRANGLLRIYNFGGHFSLDGHGTLSINGSPLTYMYSSAWDISGRGCCPTLRFD